MVYDNTCFTWSNMELRALESGGIPLSIGGLEGVNLTLSRSNSYAELTVSQTACQAASLCWRVTLPLAFMPEPFSLPNNTCSRAITASESATFSTSDQFAERFGFGTASSMFIGLTNCACTNCLQNKP